MPTETVRIRLLQDGGSPAPGERVTLLDPSGADLGSLLADESGVVEVPVDGIDLSFRIGSSSEVRRVTGNDAKPSDAPMDVMIPPHRRSVVRIYGQLIDPAGQPAAGVGLAVVRKKDKAVLGSTVSDSNGAFVLALPGRPEPDKYELRASVNEDPIQLSDSLEFDRGLVGPLRLVLERTPPRSVAVAPRPALIGDEDDVLAVFNRAPDLFSRPLGARTASPCSPYTGPDVATRVFYLNQFAMFTAEEDGGRAEVLRARGFVRGTQAASSSVSRPIEFLDPARAALGHRLRYGALLEFRQEWWELGYALGDLLYSVPLAPCEQTKIAQIDWRRHEFATRRTALDERHYQDTTIERDEAINEAVRMASDKGITGTTTGGGAGVSLGLVSGGIASSVENVDEAVEASTAASRFINDRIQQASNTLRSTRASAVAEVNEDEEVAVRTRTIRNHNHCHTLTFQYYEVIRRFLLATKLNRVRPAAFVPFGVTAFDEAAVSRYGYLLRRALLDPTLEPVLDRLLGIAAPAAGPAPAPAPADGGQEPAPEMDDPVVRDFRLYGDVTAIADGRSRVVRSDSPDLVGAVGFYLNDRRASMRRSSDPVRTDITVADATLTEEDAVRLSDIQKLTLESRDPERIRIDDFSVKVKVGTSYREVFFKPSIEIPVDGRFVEKLAINPAASENGTAPSVNGAGPAAKPDPGLARLLDHLNANAAYYTGAIISGGDAGMRYLVLSGYTDERGRNLAEIVDNNVAGVVGNYAVFPLRSIADLPDDLRPVNGDWLANPPEDRRILTLPTPGVFAESQLGQCSACEVIDNTRFWDWQSSPCPDEAPDITDAMVGSRATDVAQLLEVVKSDLEPAKLPIPDLPEPMIKIGDGTLAELVKGLELKGPEATLDFVKGLAEVSGQNFQSVVSTLSDLIGQAMKATAGAANPAAAMAEGAGTTAAGALGGTAAGEGAAGAAAGEALPAAAGALLI